MFCRACHVVRCTGRRDEAVDFVPVVFFAGALDDVLGAVFFAVLGDVLLCAPQAKTTNTEAAITASNLLIVN